MITQERELAEKRLADERRRIASSIGQQLLVRQGEQQEFGKQDYTTAITHYQEAGRLAHHPVQSGYARLLIARARARAGERQSAEASYQEILRLGAEVTDGQGLPLALYAAMGLLQAGISPHWSADGSRIVFASWLEGSSQLYRFDMRSRQSVRLTDNSKFMSKDPRWSPDGISLAFTAMRNEAQLWMLDPR